MSIKPVMTFSGENLTCLRGNNLVFEDLSFRLDPGDILLLTGANGSGKTSLMRMMAGLLVPAAGTLQRNSDCHWIGLEIPLKTDLTLGENLSFWAHVANVRGIPAAIDRALAAWHMESLRHTPLRYLSAGQRRRANLCRLLLAEREIWLLDEPCTGLDHAGIAIITSLVNGHLTQGGIAVIATHQPHLWPPATRQLMLSPDTEKEAA